MKSIWKEYSLKDPVLKETSEYFIYETTFGDYYIPKLRLNRIKFYSRKKTQLFDFIYPWIYIYEKRKWKALDKNLISNITIESSTNTLFKIKVTIKSKNKIIAYLVIKISFSKEKPPKFSFSLNPTNNWSWKFQWSWICLLNEKSFCMKESDEKAINIQKEEKTRGNTKDILKFFTTTKMIEFGENENPKSWIEWCFIRWIKEFDTFYGYDPLFSKEAIIIFFPLNEENIDPIVVSSTTNISATMVNLQEKVFYAGGLYWVFWEENGLKYSTSSDGITWSTPTLIRSIDSPETGNFDIFFDGTYFHYAVTSVVANTETRHFLYYRRGTPNSDGTITWSQPEQVAMEISTQTLYLHLETLTVGTETYKKLLTSSADASGEIPAISADAVGRYLVLKSLFPLSSVHAGLLKAGTWTIYYRTWTSARTDWHCDVDIKIIRSDGTLRDTLGADVANSPTLDGVTTPTTISGTFTLANDYIIVDETDYLEIDFYVTIEAKAANQYVYIEYDNNSLPISDQMRMTDFKYISTIYDLHRPNIAISSSGYPFIIYYYYEVDLVERYPVAVKSSTIDGTWLMDPAFPYVLNTADADALGWGLQVVPLSSDKMYFIYAKSKPVKGREWNGISMGVEENVVPYPYKISDPQAFYAVTINDNLYVFYQKGNNELAFRSRISGTWQTPEIIENLTYDAESLSVCVWNDDFYVFWLKPVGYWFEGGDYIYKQKYNGQWYNKVVWFTRTNSNTYSYITFSKVMNNKIAVIWVEGDASPYDIMFNIMTPSLPVVVIPKIKYSNGLVTININ